MGIGTCLNHWVERVKRSPQLIWPHQLSTSLLGLCLNLECAGFRPRSGFAGRVFTHCGPTEPEEGLKIDESSQNQFIAPEILACVMSGKIVLLFCLIEVHEAGTALKCLTIKVGLFFFCFFCTADSLWIAREL